MGLRNPKYDVLEQKLLDNVDTAAIISAMPDTTAASIAIAAASIMDWMNTDTIGAEPQIDGGTLYDLVDATERAALSANDKAELNVIFGTTGLKLHNGSKARDTLLAMFPGGTTTRTAFQAALLTTVKNYQKYGFSAPHFHDIEIALTPEV